MHTLEINEMINFPICLSLNFSLHVIKFFLIIYVIKFFRKCLMEICVIICSINTFLHFLMKLIYISFI